MADVLVHIRPRTGLGLGGKALSNEGDNSTNTRGSVYRKHTKRGEVKSAPIYPPVRSCFPKNYFGGISVCVSVHVSRGDSARAD